MLGRSNRLHEDGPRSSLPTLSWSMAVRVPSPWPTKLRLVPLNHWLGNLKTGGEDDIIGAPPRQNLAPDVHCPWHARGKAAPRDPTESYLRAVFRDGAGVSLGNFVRSVRLVRATYLLEQGKLDLGVIAGRTGFGSLTSFTRAFRRMYEMTPSSYRKRSRVEA